MRRPPSSYPFDLDEAPEDIGDFYALNPIGDWLGYGASRREVERERAIERPIESAARADAFPRIDLSCAYPDHKIMCSQEHILGSDMETYRFGAVADAVGLGTPALRNWLRRNQIDLFAEQPEKGWHVFSAQDVFVLAVAVQFVKFGAPVGRAVELARRCLSDTNFLTFEGLPQSVYAAPDRFGVWHAGPDKDLISKLTRSPAVLELDVPVIFVDARKRLEGGK